MPKNKTPGFIFLLLSCVVNCFAKSEKLIFLSIDERFTTRDLFLSSAEITDFQIVTPNAEILPRQKTIPDNRKISDWMERNIKGAYYAVISADMLLYGGLIASRTSNDSIDEIERRLKIFERLRRAEPRLKLFVSTTVMRMPQYSSGEEEPDYYATYGRQIFLFSQFTHRYESFSKVEDAREAELYKKQIPPEVLDDYLTRRARNFQVNKRLIELTKRGIIDRLVITLDDNAEFGFFKREAAELSRLAASIKEKTAIYPGADEAQLTLLARLFVGEKRVPTFVAYRFPESRRLIPSFEGQPLQDSVKMQVEAAGGETVNDINRAECVIYVNNFAEKNTFPPAENSMPGDVQPLENYLKTAGVVNLNDKTLVVADNRFYNGADAEIIDAIFASRLNAMKIAYAGWNTSGNTLGSAISLGFLRARMEEKRRNETIYKKLLFVRFIEDWVYMTIGRNQVRADLKMRNLNVFAGTPLEIEYENRMTELFNSRAAIVNRFLNARFRVEKTFFPWHRSFEIGFKIIGE